MEWKPTHGRILPTPPDIVRAIIDYTGIFLRIQVDWLVAFVSMVNGDGRDEVVDGSTDDCSEH